MAKLRKFWPKNDEIVARDEASSAFQAAGSAMGNPSQAISTVGAGMAKAAANMGGFMPRGTIGNPPHIWPRFPEEQDDFKQAMREAIIRGHAFLLLALDIPLEARVIVEEILKQLKVDVLDPLTVDAALNKVYNDVLPLPVNSGDEWRTYD